LKFGSVEGISPGLKTLQPIKITLLRDRERERESEREGEIVRVKAD
jgi:hypothetical protein